ATPTFVMAELLRYWQWDNMKKVLENMNREEGTGTLKTSCIDLIEHYGMGKNVPAPPFSSTANRVLETSFNSLVSSPLFQRWACPFLSRQDRRFALYSGRYWVLRKPFRVNRPCHNSICMSC